MWRVLKSNHYMDQKNRALECVYGTFVYAIQNYCSRLKCGGYVLFYHWLGLECMGLHQQASWVKILCAYKVTWNNISLNSGKESAQWWLSILVVAACFAMTAVCGMFRQNHERWWKCVSSLGKFANPMTSRDLSLYKSSSTWIAAFLQEVSCWRFF